MWAALVALLNMKSLAILGGAFGMQEARKCLDFMGGASVTHSTLCHQPSVTHVGLPTANHV
eukprot:10797016-Karenia_brevis.AAC.1